MATRLLNTARTARAALLRTPSLSCPSRQALSSLHMPAGAGTPTHNTLTLSPALMAATTSTLLSGYELIVCDMAGTTIEEGGMVYETLRQVMVDDGLDVSVEAMHPWHGAKKEAVLEHFARQCDTPLDELETRINRVADAFMDSITDKYFNDNSPVALITPLLHDYLRRLHSADIKVALDTGYPPEIQELLVKKMGFDDKTVVDGYISAYTVSEGRPYPYMIHRLMEQLGVQDVRKVAKVGDSVRDIEEGKNAGCGLVVGVLSGADSAADLLAAGADIIADCVTDLPVPLPKREESSFRSPDMS